MDKFYICTTCGRKYSYTENKPQFLTDNNKFGICGKCLSSFPYTHGNCCFGGTEYMSLVISPFYYTAQIKNAMKNYKFNRCTVYEQVFSHYIINTLSKYDFIKDFDIAVPLPLSAERLRTRGYNQSALFARRIAKHFNIAYSENILMRTRSTKKQSLTYGIDKINNVLDAFASDSDLSGMRLLLFDDIFTTGNSMNQAAKALRAVGAADVVGVTAAITPKRQPQESEHTCESKFRNFYRKFLTGISSTQI